MDGRLVYELENSSQTAGKIDTKHWKPGTYTAIFKSDKRSATARFVKI
jgi:hypothetical protein